jgi:phosphatidyl-myo-inositol dimannoside synthase
MHIGLVSNTFPPIPGGMEAYLDHLSAALNGAGHTVRVVTRFTKERPTPFSALLASSEPPSVTEHRGVTVQVMAPSGFRRLLLRPVYRLHHRRATQPLAIQLMHAALGPALRTALQGCEVVHFSGCGREMLGFVAARIARKMGVPFVVTPHMHIGSWGDGAFDFSLYRQAGALIALTAHERAFCIDQGLSPDAVHICGHGIPNNQPGIGERYRSESGLGDAPMVLFLGRKSAYKGYTRLLDAATSIWTQHPDATFVFAGPGDDSVMLSAEQEKVLGDPRVSSYGFVSDQMRDDLFAAADVFCLPSTDEAFGLVYVEAGAYGTPVVAHDIPTLRELIGTAGTGVLTQHTATDVARGCIELLSDPEKRHALGARNQELALRRTWSNVAADMASLYALLASRQPPDISRSARDSGKISAQPADSTDARKRATAANVSP